MKKTVIIGLTVALLLSSGTAFADTTTTSTTSIDQLLTLIGQLRPGMSNDQVRQIQVALSADGTVYPEKLVTGFYGKRTGDAIKRFQNKHKNDQHENDNDNNSEQGERHDKKSIDNKGVTCITATTTEQVLVGPDTTTQKHNRGRHSWNWKSWSWKSHEIAMKHCTPSTGTTTPSLPDTTAPTISGVSVSGIQTATATISWITNEAASAKIFYGSTSPVSTSIAGWSDAALLTTHGVQLVGLTPNTTYYFIVTNTDAANNTATATQGSFTTSVPADVTAPIISGFTAAPTGSTTATVSWTTNEGAKSKMYYNTTNPVNTLTIANITNPSLLTTHSVNLVGLTPNTTYYAVVTASDAANNISTSTQTSFATTN